MITIKAIYAKTLIQKTLGLIGKQKPEALFFQTRFGIHTFGMRFAIDVIILDNANCVVAYKANMQPNRIFLWNPLYKNVLELPRGEIQRLKIKIGNTIIIRI